MKELREQVIQELVRIEMDSYLCDHHYLVDCLRHGIEHPGYDNMTDNELLQEYQDSVSAENPLLIKFKLQVLTENMIEEQKGGE